MTVSNSKLSRYRTYDGKSKRLKTKFIIVSKTEKNQIRIKKQDFAVTKHRERPKIKKNFVKESVG